MANMSALLEGDILEITLKGEVKNKNDQHGCVLLNDEDGANHWIYLESSEVSAEIIGRKIDPKKGEVYVVGTIPGIWLTVENSYGYKKMISASGVEFSVEKFKETYQRRMAKKVYPV